MLQRVTVFPKWFEGHVVLTCNILKLQMQQGEDRLPGLFAANLNERKLKHKGNMDLDDISYTITMTDKCRLHERPLIWAKPRLS